MILISPARQFPAGLLGVTTKSIGYPVKIIPASLEDAVKAQGSSLSFSETDHPVVLAVMFSSKPGSRSVFGAVDKGAAFLPDNNFAQIGEVVNSGNVP